MRQGLETMTIDEYISQHIDPQPDALARIERNTHLRLVNPRMCSGHLQGRILKMLIRMTGARTVLELGTFSGYSAICMAEGLPTGGHLHTVECDDELEDFIRENLQNAGVADKVTLHIGDAVELVPRLMQDIEFDLVFIDADKRLYPKYYSLIAPKLRKGAMIVADNTLWDGHVVEPEEQRHDPQTVGIRRFNDMLSADSSMEKVIIPLRDGLTLAYKIT